jgi:hypothetical protein
VPACATTSVGQVALDPLLMNETKILTSQALSTTNTYVQVSTLSQDEAAGRQTKPFA